MPVLRVNANKKVACETVYEIVRSRILGFRTYLVCTTQSGVFSIHEVAAAAAASDNFVYIFGEPFVVAASARDFLINHFRNRFSV